MRTDYDVIVVGAGNGGLVAGATTAKAGLKTLVLEKHNIPGGSASSFVRGRFEFEPSLHELCAFGTKEHQGGTYKILDGLGVDVEWVYDDNTLRAIAEGPDGFDVTLRAGKEEFIEDMEKAVPGCGESVRKLFELDERNDKALAIQDGGKVSDLLKGLKDFMRTSSHSMEEVEDAVGMPQKAKDIFNTYWCYLGIPTDELNAMHYLSMVCSYVNFKPAMPKLRSHAISLAIEKVITDNGGEVWYNSEVTSFLYDEAGACIGVEVNGNKKLYAKEIISNVIPTNVYAMTDSKNVPENELKLANARTLGMTFVTIYIGLDATKEEMGIKDYTVFKMTCKNPREQYNRRLEGVYYVVNCLNVTIPDASPAGTSMLFYTIPMFGDDLPKDLTPEKYKKWKNDFAKKFIDDYSRAMGIDIMGHIEEIAVATPVTFARYLGTPNGEIYGYETTNWDSVVMRTAMKASEFKVKGLTYCGGHDIRGDGYSSAYYSGKVAGDAVVKKLKGGKK